MQTAAHPVALSGRLVRLAAQRQPLRLVLPLLYAPGKALRLPQVPAQAICGIPVPLHNQLQPLMPERIIAGYRKATGAACSLILFPLQKIQHRL